MSYLEELHDEIIDTLKEKYSVYEGSEEAEVFDDEDRKVAVLSYDPVADSLCLTLPFGCVYCNYKDIRAEIDELMITDCPDSFDDEERY